LTSRLVVVIQSNMKAILLLAERQQVADEAFAELRI
jgi:hypothetical protein